LLLMTVALCSPDGRPFELDDSQLCEFAIANKLIDNASHFSNVTNLINPSSGKKQLQQWQPVAKLRWLMIIDKKGELVSGRAPEPVLGNEEFFVKSVVPMKPDMHKIKDHWRLGTYL
jgi:hypothetical protein